ncbi:hypothetical protein J4402_03225 [Candidatus Pacearchaeota archaeon]|nr:hypothetical protein [Candidatus Pacearchaeota archaeon]
MSTKFFADTANQDELDFSFSKGVNEGITTNPKIMENAGVKDFETACREILKKYSSVPVSLETDLEGIPVSEIESRAEEVKEVLFRQANNLASWGANVVVKIPVCLGGLKAVEFLAKQNIKTNVTACMTPYQAVESAKAGADYVSLFANRMLDSHILELSGVNLEQIANDSKWKSAVKENREKYLEEAWEKTLAQIAYVSEYLQGGKARLIIGSIRFPEDIYRILKSGPDIITIPTGIVRQLSKIPELKQTKKSINGSNAATGNSLSHPMTSYTLEEFERAASSYRNEYKNT